MSWTLEANGVTKTFAEWGFTGLRRDLISQDFDRCTWEGPVATIESTPVLAFGDRIKIKHPNGTQWFDGTIIKVPLEAQPDSEAHGFEAAGPWWHLEENVFKQPWTILGGILKHTAHLLLNAAPGGELASTKTQIEDVLNYLLGLFPVGSKPFQIGTIEPIAFPPISEVQAISCAAAIRNQLRWVPDAVAYFDYSTDPPTFHVRQRQSLGAVSIALQASQMISLVPRTDLQRPSVAIQFEVTASENGKNKLSIIDDIAPPGATGQEPRSLNLSINLQGPTTNVAAADVESEIIDINSVDWWKTRHEPFSDARYSNIAIVSVTRELPDGSVIPMDDRLPLELIEGQLTDWMPFEWEQEVVKAKFNYEFWDGPQGGGSKKLVTVKDHDVTVRIVSTDAPSGSYQNVTTEDTGDPLPVGLAAFLYATLAPLHYDGQIVFEAAEVAGSISFGSLLNITGGKPEWATMNALVQSISEDIDLGQTTVVIGPPKHLGPADLMELLRVGRRFRFTPQATQETGETGDTGQIRLGKATPNRDSARGDYHHRYLTVKDGTVEISVDAIGKQLLIDQNDSRTIRIALTDIPALPNNSKFPIRIREVEVCENGVTMKMLVLGSASYNAQGQ